MTETYYYLWEFFTSITILALIIIYIVYDRRQVKREKEEIPAAPVKATPVLSKKNKKRA
jgi:hypothetical protein